MPVQVCDTQATACKAWDRHCKADPNAVDNRGNKYWKNRRERHSKKVKADPFWQTDGEESEKEEPVPAWANGMEE